MYFTHYQIITYYPTKALVFPTSFRYCYNEMVILGLPIVQFRLNLGRNKPEDADQSNNTGKGYVILLSNVTTYQW